MKHAQRGGGVTIMTDREPSASVRARNAPPEDRGSLTLLARIGGSDGAEVWSARLDDGRVVSARYVHGDAAMRPARLREKVAALREVSAPSLLRVLGTAAVSDARAVWVLSELVDGVPLRRLMSVAEVHPVQMLAVVRAVTRGLIALGDARFSHGAVGIDAVHVGADGTVRLGIDAAAARRCTRASQRRDLEDVAALLRAMLADGPRRGVGGVAAVELAGRLRALAESERLAQAPTLAAAAAMVDECSGGAVEEEEARATAQFAALVRTVRGGPAMRAPKPPAGAPRVEPVAREAAARQPAAAARKTPESPPPARNAAPSLPSLPSLRSPRWLLPALGAGALVVLLLGVGLALALHGRGHAAPAAASHAPHHASAAAPPAKRGPSPQSGTLSARSAPGAALPALGPASTTTVSRIAAPAVVAGCTTGGACTVTVRVFLPAHGTENVAWSLAVVDRCTGAVTRATGGSVLALPQYQFVFDASTITLPAGRPVAVIAVTSAPSTAASPPLLLGPSTC